MVWSKSHIHSLGPIHRNEAVNLPDDQTVAGEKTFSKTTRIQAALAGNRLKRPVSRGQRQHCDCARSG
jgi:hypothetical protein